MKRRDYGWKVSLIDKIRTEPPFVKYWGQALITLIKKFGDMLCQNGCQVIDIKPWALKSKYGLNSIFHQLSNLSKPDPNLFTLYRDGIIIGQLVRVEGSRTRKWRNW